jgi:hypothetical protein
MRQNLLMISQLNIPERLLVCILFASLEEPLHPSRLFGVSKIRKEDAEMWNFCLFFVLVFLTPTRPNIFVDTQNPELVAELFNSQGKAKVESE